MDHSSDSKPKPESGGDDVVLVHSKVDDGEGWRVLRAREGRVEAGILRTVEEGRPIAGELVTLAPRAGVPEGAPIFDVDVHYVAPRGRPAQVATPAYRAHWDEIFGAHASAGDAPN